MKRGRKILGPFVPMLVAIWEAPAWRAMDPIARLLWIALRRKLRNGGLNNGKIWLSCRDAAEEIGGNKDTIAAGTANSSSTAFYARHRRASSASTVAALPRTTASPISPTAHTGPRAIMRNGTGLSSKIHPENRAGKNRIPYCAVGHPVLRGRT
jgi:hypothetical protein